MRRPDMVKTKNSRLCLVVYREEAGIGKVLETLHSRQKEIVEKLGSASQKLGDILVVHSDLTGAIYNARTQDRDYWGGSHPDSASPGKVSVLYHPMYMEVKALEEYLRICCQESYLPVVLADFTTITERKLESDTSTVGREFQSLRSVMEKLAESEGLTFQEMKLQDLIRI
jgi:hypothetical protein